MVTYTTGISADMIVCAHENMAVTSKSISRLGELPSNVITLDIIFPPFFFFYILMYINNYIILILFLKLGNIPSTTSINFLTNFHKYKPPNIIINVTINAYKGSPITYLTVP